MGGGGGKGLLLLLLFLFLEREKKQKNKFVSMNEQLTVVMLKMCFSSCNVI